MNTTKTWKRIVSILMAVLMLLSITPISTYMDVRSNAATNTKTIFLKANSSYWDQSGAWFAAWAWVTNQGGAWYIGTDSNDDGVYAFTVPSDVNNIIFMRMASGATAPSWTQGDSGYWNKTGDLTISGNYYSITNWNGGTWSNATITYIVAGSPGLTGSDWDSTNTSNQMTKNSDGTYSKTYSNVPAGNYEYKIVGNGEWMWDGSNGTVNVTQTSNVTITFNPSTNAYTPKVEAVATSYSVTFELTNVTKTNGSTTATGGTQYTATLAASSGYTLPDSITVKAGSTTLTSGTHYSYNSSTGAIIINGSAITGNLTITASGAPLTFADKVYLDPGPWSTDAPRMVAYFYGNGDPTWVMMIDANGDGVYECNVPEGYTSVIFVRMDPKSSEISWDSKWNQTNDLSVPTDSNNCYTITGYGADGQPSNGTWGPFTGDNGGNGGSVEHIDEKPLNSDDVFYVDTDIVDYLNDYRVINNQVYGYYSNNEGVSNDRIYSSFSYLNSVISAAEYTSPLYFGSLNYIGCRYSRIVGQETRYGLSNWSTVANVALANQDGTAETGASVNTDAVVQGLVGTQLANGTLADPNGDPLLYFNKDAATNNGHAVMAYYDGLLFPFVKSYNKETKVTKYSYNSASDYAVYYDYANNQLYASNTKVLDSTLDGNSNANDYGFYPLNKPGDTGNALNHGFGAKFNINFTVGEDGKLDNGDDVTFKFTGDDDVWVFIDGILVLDMGGAHSMAEGTINFATKTAFVSNACTINDSYFYTTDDSNLESSYRADNLPNYVYTDGQERATATTGQSNKSFSELGLSFDYGKTHTMTVFYMERGGIESNFSMEFTMIPVPSGLTLSKELNSKEINGGLIDAISNVSDYDFDFVATSPSDTSVAFQSFTLTNKQTGEVTLVTPNGNSSSNAYSAAIQGITNYTYAHSFFTDTGEHAFIPGTQFSITESTKSIFNYNSTTWKVYDAKNGFAETNYKGTGQEATFTMGSAEENTSYSYAVVFTNNMALGTLQISKVFNDPFLKDTAFTFQVYLDLDGNGNTFSEQLYNKLVYTVDGGEPITSSDGTVSITGGQTAVISGIPAGATYRLVEVISKGDPWTQTASSNTSGTIAANGLQTASFTNTTIKHSLEAKMIFVEAGASTATNYALTHNGQPVTVTKLSNISSGLTAVNNSTSVSVTGAQPNMVYTMEYSGRLPNGEIVSGVINVYTYAATKKTYVFDFGLPSNLADTTRGDGLFQGGAFYNSGYTDTTATLISLTPDASNKQTTVSAALNGIIGTNSSYSAITFSPVGFMSQVETYTYTVRISVNGIPFDEDDPETGTILTGKIMIMPANAVYYEDNFNKGGSSDPANKIIYSNGGPSSALPNSMVQSNDQSGNYGYDPIYNGGYTQSAGSATTMTNGQFAYFTFHGTGFDLISRTNGSTAGFAVYVFTGGHTQAKQEYMTKFSGAVPADMVFVDTYYNNGDLHQVPVVSVRLNSYGEYTVYIQALATRVGDVALPDITDVSIDGIRIYDPLADTSLYPLKAEQDATVDELRVLYGVNNIVSLAGRDDDGVFNGLGKGERVENALESASIVEDMKGNVINSASDIESIFKHGPNNEMYLPMNFGISFSYTVNDSDWTLQLGAKAVTAEDISKSITIYAKSRATGTYTEVKTIELSSATDMYYDLTTWLDDYDTVGSTYDIIIISNSEFANNEFVSLTTVKHAGITLS